VSMKHGIFSKLGVDVMRTVRRLGLAGLVVVGFLLAIQPATAHHSSAGFNADVIKEITGTVKEFQFQNPHTWIQIWVTGEQGQREEWSVEWGSPNSLARRGIRPSTFPPDARVTMRIRPMLNGAPAGGFVGAKFADGTTVGNWED
jgi:2,4-dienoyl-CoA reductase-like NADH-dependent reductase (Old Yellow Enzyme family)